MDRDILEKVRLLLVDDEDGFRAALMKRFQKRGIRARQAADGRQALALLAETPQDVVVMDVRMPGMGGIEALGQIRRKYPETEVILLTGHAATADGVEGMKSGAFDYLTKPVEFDHLLGKIGQAYEKILADQQQKSAIAYKQRIEEQMIATERLAALGPLAAGVAHEINNPLAIINESAGYLLSLVNKWRDHSEREKAVFSKNLKNIEKSVKRARTITHQLLTSVRESTPVLAEVDLAVLVQETIQLVAREAADKGVSVKLTKPDTPPVFWIDANPLRQVLINLLTNAIQATPTGGAVTVGLASTADGASITVRDTGSGIPKEHLNAVFEPFFSTKAPGEGTGLGLFVTREIIEKFGGRVDVSSQPGQGACFTVYIPNQIPGHPAG